MSITISLPFPDRALHPNSRPHWSTKARKVKFARDAACWQMKAALGPRKVSWERVSIHWVFHPKTKHPIDDDGAVASCKSYRDGIADALGIDDSKFRSTHEIREPVKGGKVTVTIMEGEK